MRLDQYLVFHKLAASRTRSQRLIEEKKVSVNGSVTTKPSYKVQETDSVKLLEPDFKWASRGAFKLIKALSHWDLVVDKKTCLDVGASTGGFTEVLLDNGALKVFALDVGHGQIVDSLRKDERVAVLEKTDIRLFETTEKFDFVTVDVSFISLKLVLPSLPKLLNDHSTVVCLIKPQFEVGPDNINTKGLVKNPALYKVVIKDLESRSKECGFDVVGVIESPIEGGDGNKEFLMHLKWSATKT